MAKKKEETEEMTVAMPKKREITLHLVGEDKLILCKKSRSFEEEEKFKQSHKKGTAIPDKINSKLHYCLWEKLCTSIDWENPIPEPDNYEDYTEEMYREIMETNHPCIKSNAFIGSFIEAFISFGFKDATGRTGADFKRCVRIRKHKTPVDFTAYDYDQRLVPNNTVSHTNVLAQNNEFSGWSCDLELSFIENVFPLPTILSVVSLAGENLGIGTRRAEGYGSYKVESVIG